MKEGRQEAHLKNRKARNLPELIKKNDRFLELIKIPITLLFSTRVGFLELKLFTKYINNNTLQLQYN